METKRTSIFPECILCLFIGSIVRILYCWKYPVSVRDAFAYSSIIEQWINQGSIPVEKGTPPLGLFLLKIPAEYFYCDIIKGGIIINMILGLAIIYIIGHIVYEICPSKKTALLIMLIGATHPSMVQYSCQMLRENSYLFFCCLTFYFGIRYIKNKHVFLICPMAFFCATSYLCRHEALENIIIICLIIFLYPKDRLIKRLNKCFLFVVSLGFSFAAVSKILGVPWQYYYLYTKELSF